MQSNELRTIHEVRSELEKSLKFIEDLNKEYLDHGTIDSYKLRSVYEYLVDITTSKWTNETF